MALIRQIPYSDIVFLAHFTGGGIGGVLDLIFWVFDPFGWKSEG